SLNRYFFSLIAECPSNSLYPTFNRLKCSPKFILGVMPRASTLLMTGASFLLTAATIGNAFLQKKQFYPSVVYITKSSPSMAVMYIQAMVIAYMIFQVVRKLFFGQLRASETEHLSERTWHAVMETCLAFTVFRDDFSPRFVMQFVLLLFVKSFHWLSEDRVDFMERSPVITILFHCRMMSLLAFLSSLDSYFISHAYFTTLVKGASVQIVFGFEYAILMTVVFHVMIKYILHMHDLRSVHPWENKAVYLLYSELVINLLRCVLYTVFVGVMIRLHTFPLFSIRPLYLTVRAFHKAVNDVILSRRAIHAMNNLFPLATEQELTQGDNTCIICREEMTPTSGAKKLPCNHIFHSNCLRSWFQRQQSCPTCRTDILAQRHAPAAAAAATPARQAAGGAPAGGAEGGAQPGAVPGAANAAELPPNMFPFMAHHFGFPPPQQQQNNNNTNTVQPQPREGGAEQGTAPQPNAQLPFPPPFGFMPPPVMMMPPPVPLPFPQPPSFAGLTDAEVAAMEGHERAAVEARVTCLRNIAILLDAATIQLQQYTSIVQALSVPNVGATMASSSDQPAAASNDPQESMTATKPGTSGMSQVSTNNALSTTTAPANSNLESKKAPTLDATSNESRTSNGTAVASTDVSDLRQRRLQRFASTQSNASSGPPTQQQNNREQH
uniref:E3 ubiquitin-protein ligase hrd-1 n=2 Tax=Parascaris univalens TaxID=6257 RepID=A0A914ZLD8_PARUN